MPASSTAAQRAVDVSPVWGTSFLSTCTEHGHDTRWVIQAVLAQTYELP